MKTKNGGAVLLLWVMSFATSMAVMAGSIESDNVDYIDYFILKECQETPSTGDPKSAGRAVDPGTMLAAYIGNYVEKRWVEPSAVKNITLLEGTQHGKIFSEVDNVGLTSFHYDPIPNYVGNDRAVFMAELEGKRYKIVVNIVVTLNVGESPLMEGEQPVCPPPQLIKVNGKPVSGSSVYDLNTIPVSFTDLPGAAVGQTTRRRTG